MTFCHRDIEDDNTLIKIILQSDFPVFYQTSEKLPIVVKSCLGSLLKDEEETDVNVVLPPRQRSNLDRRIEIILKVPKKTQALLKTCSKKVYCAGYSAEIETELKGIGDEEEDEDKMEPEKNYIQPGLLNLKLGKSS